MIEVPTALPDGLASDPPDGPGLYFLTFGVQVVYIGASLTPEKRARQHARKIAFDAVHYLAVPVNELGAAERNWIERLQPLYNTLHNPGREEGDPSYPHQPGHIVRVREELFAAATKGADAEYTTPTGFINKLLRRALEQEGLLPPSKRNGGA